jgi:cytochrome c-type biogenesis protein CcmH/NrfF
MRLRSLLAPAVAAALFTGPAVSQDRYNSADYQRVTHALTCQCGGCNALLGECAMDRCPSSEPIREEVAERLQAGENPEDIIGTFAERYGLVILSAPPTSGFHLSAWVLPVVFLLGGAVLAVVVLRRWRSAAPAAAAPAATAADIPPEVLARIERDVEQIR